MAVKIRAAAMMVMSLCFLAALILVLVFAEDALAVGLGLAASSIVAGWLTYIMLTGFAELLERAATQEAYLKLIHEELKVKAATPSKVPAKAEPSVATKAQTAAQKGTNVAETLLDTESRQALEEHQLESCPACGMVQRAGRNVCWKCGVKLTKPEQE